MRRRDLLEIIAREREIMIGEIMIGGYANLHDSSCVGRRCLKPEHLGEEKAIDVQPIREETALVPYTPPETKC